MVNMAASEGARNSRGMAAALSINISIAARISAYHQIATRWRLSSSARRSMAAARHVIAEMVSLRFLYSILGENNNKRNNGGIVTRFMAMTWHLDNDMAAII